MKRVLVLLIVFVAFSSCSTINSDFKDGKIKVATTIFPLKSVVESIVGDKVEVVNLLAPGASPHTFSLSPSDVKALTGSQKLFAVGHGLDQWAVDILKSVNDTELVVVDRGINLKIYEAGQADPHYWLSSKNIRVVAQTVLDEIVKIDAVNEAYYRENFDKFLLDLDELDTYIEGLFSDLKNKDIVVFHDSWGYFAEQYGLNIIGVFELSPGIEPGPKDLADLYYMFESSGAKSIFSESQFSSESIKSFVNDLDLKVGILDPLGGTNEKDSYIKLMRYNANVIFETLNE